MNELKAGKVKDYENPTETKHDTKKTFDEFDLYYVGKQEQYRKSAEDIDKSISTQHISSVAKPLSGSAENKCFRQDDEVCLKYAAHNWQRHHQST